MAGAVWDELAGGLRTDGLLLAGAGLVVVAVAAFAGAVALATASVALVNRRGGRPHLAIPRTSVPWSSRASSSSPPRCR